MVTARCMPSASSDPTAFRQPRAEEPGQGCSPRTRGHRRALASLLAGAITLLAAPPPLAASLTPVERGWARGVFPVVSFAGFTSGFGMRLHPLSGSLRSHDGIDIAAPLGSPVRSWWTGRVQEVVLDGGCGNGLVIRSGAYEHIYCHLGGTVVNGTYNVIVPDSGTLCWPINVSTSGTATGTGTATGWGEDEFPSAAATLYLGRQLVQDRSNGQIYEFRDDVYAELANLQSGCQPQREHPGLRERAGRVSVRH